MTTLFVSVTMSLSIVQTVISKPISGMAECGLWQLRDHEIAASLLRRCLCYGRALQDHKSEKPTQPLFISIGPWSFAFHFRGLWAGVERMQKWAEWKDRPEPARPTSPEVGSRTDGDLAQ